MRSQNFPNLTAALLRSYGDHALRNANELFVEASLLLKHDHTARAYFLAVASIEEAGKALLAFDSQNRNLSDPAVCKALRTRMERHDDKINYALSTWAFNSPDSKNALKVALDLIIHLKRGREPAMYCDLKTDPDRVQLPSVVVRPTAARDCVKLAGSCLAHASKHVREKTPENFTVAQDKLFAMKHTQFQDMLNNEDFWLYHISRMQVGQHDIAASVDGYERDHIKSGKLFRDLDDLNP